MSFGQVRLNMTIQKDLIQAPDLASGVKARKGRKDLGRPIRKLAQTLAGEDSKNLFEGPERDTAYSFRGR